MKEFNGEFIREVWDFRLSSAVPTLYNTGDTWVVAIHAKNNPDYDPLRPETLAEPLEVYDTGIPTKGGNINDREAIKACYEWLYSVRNKHALDHIELRKPLVKMINEANIRAGFLNAEAEISKADGDIDAYHRCKGRLHDHVTLMNGKIGVATKAFHDQVAAGGAS